MTDEPNITAAEAMRRDLAELSNLPNPDHEVDRVMAEMGDRQAKLRVAYRDEIAARAPAEKAEPAHKPDAVPAFKAFEIEPCVRFSMPGSDNRDFVQSLKESGFATIEEARQATVYPYKDHFWVLNGIAHDGEPVPMGQFKTEDLARDVLGGITGDRRFDQHPAQDWQSVTAWSDFVHVEDKASLSERVVGHLTNDETARLQDARDAARQDLAARLYDQKGAVPVRGKDTQTDADVWQEVHERTGQRPNEQFLGQGQRW